MQNPRGVTELRSFLIFSSVYRSFVPAYYDTAAPLNNLLKKGQLKKLDPFGKREDSVFRALIDVIISPVILSLPQDGLPYSVDTDARNYQICVALFKAHHTGERRPIFFWSRTLRKA